MHETQADIFAIAEQQIAPAENHSRDAFLAGLIGSGIGGSRSPMLHQGEGDAQGARLIYTLYDFNALGLSVGDISDFLRSARNLKFSGLNVTYPYKQAVIPFLDELSDEARRIGAVNTIAFRDGIAKGYNTDGFGFGESLIRGLPGAALDVVVQIGAGGAGAATAHTLLEMGAGLLLLHDQDLQRAESLAENLRAWHGSHRVRIGSDLVASLAAASGVLNATPMGMTGHPGIPLPAAALRPELWVADIIYFPLETELLRAARNRGCRTLGGSGMVVFQAGAAFNIFTGLTADLERMLRNFQQGMANEAGARKC